ncbi:caspase family protein [Nocardia amamiensis]|uniref:Caspase family protein n=1 Tax=Nocardia amamiensis TaxID=404578 RepID=A0ABS0CUZ0_9NOCA|nr:caspase family protein [Nocardia amamiensis]MBF6300430.1 caspase family protein [Nocardia amamiensis]
MSSAFALHIGLDLLDPSAYAGWNGRLYAAENDANTMADLTADLGYRSRTLLSAEATTSAIFDAIAGAAQTLEPGDIFVLTYAGHGGQFEDITGDEADQLDETWLLYDREILDDELNMAFSDFRNGVRVLLISDSCHSGTVAREYYKSVLTESGFAADAYTKVAARLGSRDRATYRQQRKLKARQAPPALQADVLKEHRDLYHRIRSSTPRSNEIAVNASIILMAACQDNQVSLENDGHGVFTAALLDRWRRGEFRGSYRSFCDEIIQELPATQSPNFFESGRAWPEYVNQQPFTIEAPAGAIGPTQGSGGDLQLKPAAYRVEISRLDAPTKY